MKSLIYKTQNKINDIFEKIGEKKIYKILIIFFLILAIAQIFIPGLPLGHDMSFHLSRIEGITEGLKNGTFPVLIYPGYLSGYGYANGVFYPDLFLYIPAFLHFIGLSTILSYKVFILLVTIAIFFSMYFVTKKITKSDFSSTMISILYLMSSYRITDMWIRFAIGETLTFIFIPFVILGLYELIYKDYKNWKYLTIGLSGVVLSHLLSGILCIIVVLIFVLCNFKKIFDEKQRLKYLLISGFLAIGITFIFTGPLLEMMMSDNFVYQNYTSGDMVLKRSVNPIVTIVEIPSKMLPWVPQGIGIVFVYLFFKFIKTKVKNEDEKKFKNICIISGIILLFASTKLFPWSIFGRILGIIQFPWRFYILVTIFLLLGFAILIKNKIKTSKEKINSIIVLSTFALFTYAVGTFYTLRAGQVHDYKKHQITWGEYVPLDVDYEKYEERGNVITFNNKVDVDFEKKGTNMKVSYSNNVNDNTYLELPLLYYKGYVAIDQNNNELDIQKGENGVIRVLLENESGNFSVYYGITTMRKISIVITLISITTFIILNRKKSEEI